VEKSGRVHEREYSRNECKARPQNEEDVDNSKSTWVGADAVEPSFFLRPIYVVFVWIMFGNRDLDFASGLRLRNFLDFGLGFQLGLSKVLQLYPSYGSRTYNKWSRVAQLYVIILYKGKI
jgi:hypothetical protein